MVELTDRERKTLLDTAKQIRAYKLMQAHGYKKLLKKAADERTNQLLTGINAGELSDAESWSQRIEQLAGGARKPGLHRDTGG
jgi:hypothetical protein